MTLAEFKSSLHLPEPPDFYHPLLKALWHDAKGNWNMAHTLAQDINTSDGSWVHAYLHRKEGDLGNAAYWYHRANQKMPSQPLSLEWENIVTRLTKL